MNINRYSRSLFYLSISSRIFNKNNNYIELYLSQWGQSWCASWKYIIRDKQDTTWTKMSADCTCVHSDAFNVRIYVSTADIDEYTVDLHIETAIARTTMRRTAHRPSNGRKTSRKRADVYRGRNGPTQHDEVYIYIYIRNPVEGYMSNIRKLF